MTKAARFSAGFVGGGDLLIQCAEVLVAEGHGVSWVVSSDAAVVAFCARHQIRCLGHLQELRGTELPGIEYLFSINNGHVLKEDVLGLAGKWSVNYHNAPLPEYAGVHATSWALLGGEPEHGVTWHLAMARVDGGAILKQAKFRVSAKDTARQLDVSCHELGLELFVELVQELAQGTAKAMPQDDSRRSYFGLHQKAPGFGRLSWDRSASELQRVVGAHTVNPGQNRFGLPKIALGSGGGQGVAYCVPLDARSGPSAHGVPGGTVMNCAPGESLSVATADGCLLIDRLQSLDGRHWEASALASDLGVKRGTRLPVFSEQQQRELQRLAEAASRHEAAVARAWQLAHAVQSLPPVAVRESAAEGAVARASLSNICGRFAQGEPERGDVLLGAWVSYLARYALEDQLAFSLSTPHLRKVAAESAGVFVPGVPVTFGVDGGSRFEETVQRVREERESAERRGPVNADLPLRRRELRHLAGQSLEVAVVLDPETDCGAGVGHAGLVVSVFTDRCELVLSAGPGEFTYSLEALQAMAAHLEQFSHGVGAASGAEHPAQAVDFRTEHDRCVVREAAGPVQDFGDESIVQRFLSWVNRTPERVAVRYGQTSLSYGDMGRWSRGVARALSDAGVGADSRVLVHLPRGPELAVTLLAILELGAVYVPLDPSLPRTRLAFIARDVAPAAWVTSPLDACWPEMESLPVVDVQAARGATSGARPTPPGEAKDALAYIMYTSGSTGAPRGVCATLCGLTNRLFWSQSVHPISEGESLLQNAATGFDISVWEILFPLIGGGVLVVAGADVQGDTSELKALIASHRVAFAHWVPSQLRELLRDELPGGALSSLRVVITGGEVVDPGLLGSALRALPDARLFQAYGPTEASISVTHRECSAQDASATRVPLGRPISNARLSVRDRLGIPVPVGVAGELFIGGIPVALGYVGDVGGERFCADEDGGRVYRTGDMVRYRSDGELEFLGRNDSQVKLRGHRLEPGEVEAHLLRNVKVAEAVVSVHGSGADAVLVAHVVAADAQPTEAELRRSLSRVLPRHMVPTVWLFLDALPRLPNSKLDRRALPAPSIRYQRGRDTPLITPRSPLEERLASVWAELLGLDSAAISVDDDFFALGGHSLIGTRLVSWVRDELGVTLSLRSVFDHPTVERFARLIESRRADLAGALGGSPRASAPVVPPASDSEVARGCFSSAQRRIWFSHQLLSADGAGAVYNSPIEWRLQGHLDADALAAALGDVVARHETLRARVVEGVALELTYDAPSSIRLVRREASELASLGAHVEELAAAPFDLTREGPFRAELVALAPDSHLLVCVFHHIAFDEWSADVFESDLDAFYRSRVGGEPPLLQGLARRYGELSAEEGVSSLHAAHAGQRYWLSELASAPVEPPLPRPYPTQLSSALPARRVRERMEGPAVQRLREAARAHGATLYMAFLAAFQMALLRLSSRRDIVVGTPMANRGQRGSDALVGLFVNPVALRSRIAAGARVRDVLEATRDSVLRAVEHQSVPFEQVVDGLGVAREAGNHPLFQVMFAFHDQSVRRGRLGDLRSERRVIPTPHAMYALTLEATVGTAEVELCYEYGLGALGPEDVGVIASAVARVLDCIAEQPSARVDDIELVSPEEARAHARLLTGGVAPPWVGAHAGELVFARVAEAPAALAVVHGSATLTYGELHARAETMADGLFAKGVRRGAVVGICLDRSVDFVVATLALWKIGAAYLPLVLTDPRARLNLMLKDASAVGVVGLCQHPEGLAAPMWSVEELRACSVKRPNVQRSPSDVAYVIYTSGTTGAPKGVAIEQASVANYALSAAESFGLSPGERLLQFASLGFDAAVEEIFGTLVAGATLVLRDDEMIRSPRSLFDACEQYEISVLDLPTAYFHHLAQRVHAEQTVLPRTLRLVVVGGEALKGELLDRWRESAVQQGRAVGVRNTYGPTEATVVATEATLDEPLKDGAVPIGRPVANAYVRVLDGSAHVVPPYVSGELCVGGTGVARGYVDDPRNTAERFIPDPLAAAKRLYRTGDRAWYDAAGDLHYLGRTDQQLKLRGFRVDIEEVEGALAVQEGVSQAGVYLQDAEPSSYLVGCFVSESELSTDAMREALRARLPEYMVPAKLVRIDRVSVTPNGKVDRSALALAANQIFADARRVGDGSGEQEPALTQTESELRGLWREILPVAEIPRSAHFFELGGHSLLALELCARVADRLNVDLPLKTVFRHPVLADIAAEIDRTAQDPSAFTRERRLPQRERRAKLSSTQQGLLFAEGYATEPGVFHIPVLLKLFGELDRDRLQNSLCRLEVRHEALRLRLVDSEGSLEQRAAGPGGFVLPEVPRLIAHGDLSRWAQEESEKPFQLQGGPLVRAAWVQLAPTEHALLLVLHHMVADGASIRILSRDLREIYCGHERSGKPKAFLDWTREDRAQDVAGGLQYFQRQLRDVSRELALPVDRQGDGERGHRGGIHTWRLSSDVLGELRAVARRGKTTLFAVLAAGWSALLSRYSGQGDVVLGVPLANRDQSELLESVGPFVNTVPLLVRVSQAGTLAELVMATGVALRQAQQHNSVPFADLVESLGEAAQPKTHPIYQVTLDLEERTHAEEGTSWGDGLACEEVPVTLPVAWLGLALTGRASHSGLELELRYGRDVFLEATIRQLSKHLDQMLRALVEFPTRAPERAELMDRSECEQLLRLCGGPEGGETPVSLLHMFDAQARRTPDKVAVLDGSVTLSYSELQRSSEHLAAYLRTQGVVRGRPVAVHLPRSAALVQAILALFRLNAVYLPLDPAQPSERLVRILTDSTATCVLGDGPVGPAWADAVSVMYLDWTALSMASRAGALVDSAETGGQALGGQVPPSAKDPAYLMYTSGSTGVPKGVLSAHGGIANRVAWSLRIGPLGGADALLQVATPGFDISLWEIFAPLCGGARLLIAADGAHQDLAGLVDTVEREGVTVLHMVPSLLGLFVEHGDLSRCLGLRYVVVGGERLPCALRDEFVRRLPTCRLLHAYGPTEASISVTHWECSPGDPAGPVPLGSPIDNARVYVLDSERQLAPWGAVGEIAIAGEPLALGYWNDETLTKARFVEDPCVPGGRMYLTGDWGRLTRDAGLAFLGRRDGQIKVNGVRVEPAEIEALLLEHEAVHTAAVVASDVPGVGPRLAAYVVLVSGSAPADDCRKALMRYLRQRLPSSMVPAGIMLLSEWPLLASGKLNRSALPALSGTAAEEESAHVPPSTEREKVIAALLSDILGAPKVSMNDHFMSLGGDSIASIRLVSRARAAGLGLELRDIFSAETIADIASGASPILTTARPARAKSAGGGALPLSPIQKSAFDAELIEPAGFVQRALFSSAQSLDVERLRAAITCVVNATPAFRLRFEQDAEGVWCQRVSPGSTCEFIIHEEEVPSGAGELSGVATKLYASNLGFDLQRGPLLAVLIQHGPGGVTLGMVAHHLVIDAVSWGIFLEHIETMYAKLEFCPAAEPPMSSCAYTDWVLALQEWARSAEGRAEAAFWSAPASAEPLAGRASGADKEAQTRVLSLDVAATKALLSVPSQAYRATVEDVLVAAWALTAHEVCGETHTEFLREGHGRHEVLGLVPTDVIGWFTAQHPVRVQLTAPGDLGASLLDAKEQLRQIPGGGVGFGALLLWGDSETQSLLKKRERSRVSFNYLGISDESGAGLFRRLSLPPLTEEQRAAEQSPLHAELEITAGISRTQAGAQLQVEFGQPGGGRRALDLQALGRVFETHLRRLITHCQGDAFGYSVSDFPRSPLSRGCLQRALSGRRGVRDVLPLSPLQEGMLFSELRGGASSAYMTQILFDVTGPLDPDVLRAAVMAVHRHFAVFRTGFITDNISEPVQFVLDEAPPSFTQREGAEFRAVGGEEAGVERWLAEDRAVPFSLVEPPLSRFQLARLESDRALLLWTHHHILLDGWSLPLVARAIAVAYGQLTRGQEVRLAPTPAYGRYLDWISRKQAESSASAFWRTQLSGVVPRPPQPRLAGAEGPGRARAPRSMRVGLSTAVTESLKHVQEHRRWTLSSMVAAAWILVTAKFERRKDVTLGVTLSVRPPDIEGVESMVGLCMNTVPLRLKIPPGGKLETFLETAHEGMLALHEHAADPLSSIQRASGVSGRLFDTVFVFENYPGDRTGEHLSPAVRARVVTAIETTEYPLTLVALPGDTLDFELTFTAASDEASLKLRAAQLVRLLGQIASAFDGKPSS